MLKNNISYLKYNNNKFEQQYVLGIFYKQIRLIKYNLYSMLFYSEMYDDSIENCSNYELKLFLLYKTQPILYFIARNFRNVFRFFSQDLYLLVTVHDSRFVLIRRSTIQPTTAPRLAYLIREEGTCPYLAKRIVNLRHL